MTDHIVSFEAGGEEQTAPHKVHVPTGTLLSEAARLAGLELAQPCGGQGRCGRCAVLVTSGTVRRRSTLRLTPEDVAAGYALACQSVVEGDLSVVIPAQEKIERRLTTDRTAGEVTPPEGYDHLRQQSYRRVRLELPEPGLDDQTDDWSRLQTALRLKTGIRELSASLTQLQKIGKVLRQGDWKVTLVLEVLHEHGGHPDAARLVAIYPGRLPSEQTMWGAAIDIGTTTVSLWLVDLVTGQVKVQTAEYNQQINRGEDVVSRIIYASRPGGSEEMRKLVLETINQLVHTACERAKITPELILKATIAGNSTMMHLLLGLPAENIRLAPYITTANHIPPLTANQVGLDILPEAAVDCLPGVASYVGADITAGVLSSGMDDTSALTLFLDVGTNGEIVLGNRDWLATCACSAGPAFEGAGVQHGMRATRGAIEEVWISTPDKMGADGAQHPGSAPHSGSVSHSYEPSIRVIGGGKPKGICGSGLLSLLAELFLTGLLDKGGNFNTGLPTSRLREGLHGWEYVLAWKEETAHGQDIVFTRTDIDNLLRAKAAIFAGFSVLADSVGVSLDMVEQVLIGGSFGKYLNVEKAVQIGLLPDMPWERFNFLGNTSVRGAYYALLDRDARTRLQDIAGRMTYIELSADNSFYEAFMAAMFLPHTDLRRFPTVESALYVV